LSGRHVSQVPGLMSSDMRGMYCTIVVFVIFSQLHAVYVFSDQPAARTQWSGHVFRLRYGGVDWRMDPPGFVVLAEVNKYPFVGHVTRRSELRRARKRPRHSSFKYWRNIVIADNLTIWLDSADHSDECASMSPLRVSRISGQSQWRLAPNDEWAIIGRKSISLVTVMISFLLPLQSHALLSRGCDVTHFELCSVISHTAMPGGNGTQRQTWSAGHVERVWAGCLHASDIVPALSPSSGTNGGPHPGMAVIPNGHGEIVRFVPEDIRHNVAAIPRRIGVCVATLYGDNLQLRDWLRYHSAQGIVDEFHLYVDYSQASDALVSELRASSEAYTGVWLHSWNGTGDGDGGSTGYHWEISSHGSYGAYSHCAMTQMYRVRMLLFLDTDDYLTMGRTDNVDVIRSRLLDASVVWFDWLEMDYCCLFAPGFNESTDARFVLRREQRKYGVFPLYSRIVEVHTLHMAMFGYKKHTLAVPLSSRFTRLVDFDLEAHPYVDYANSSPRVLHKRCRPEWIGNRQHCAGPWRPIFRLDFNDSLPKR